LAGIANAACGYFNRTMERPSMSRRPSRRHQLAGIPQLKSALAKTGARNAMM
jgi:hypothetical protein